MDMKNHGICDLPLIPVRKIPSEQSEMVTQILFGETFDILEVKDRWSFVTTHFNNYQGWITSKMFRPLDQEELKIYQNTEVLILKQPISFVTINQKSYYLPGGSALLPSGLNSISPENLHYPGSPVQIIETAIKYLNAPYLWGGRSVMGIDCSGFTQVIYKMNGIAIPRDAYQQAETGLPVASLEDTLPGDLAFFRDENGVIMHTGILLDNHRIIHASGHVHVDRITPEGIINGTTQTHSHRLFLIKRFI